MSSQPQFTIKLFYSYCHKDSKHREDMEKSLTLLRDQDGILKYWSDQQILPGQDIPERIEERIKPAFPIWIISFVGPNAVFSCKIKVLASPCHHLARGPNG